MKNEEIADIFDKIAAILELKKVQWKPSAYRKAARSLRGLGEDVEDIYKNGGQKALDEIPGIGESLSEKIIEYIKTNKINEWEKLKKKLPKAFYEMLNIPGMGVKTAQKLYKKLKIKSLKDLEKAAKKHKIQKLAGFKEKREEDILEGIDFVRRTQKNKRRLLGYVLPIAENLRTEILKLEGIKQAEIAGSIRRMKETIGDIDILILGEKGSIKKISSIKNIRRILAMGPSKASVILKQGIQVDVRLIKKESYGSALQYFTGNKTHSIELRKIAIKKGLKLNEYGIFKKDSNKQVAGKTEQEVYKKLGMQFIPPELREARGEIETALKHRIPKLIDYKDAKGDLHMHSTYSDGANSIKEMAEESKKLGHKYVALTDHAGEHLPIAHAMSLKQIKKQWKEINSLNKKLDGIKILKGAEVDILSDGSLSLPNKILKELDIVTISVHSGFRSSEEKMTSRVLKALDNPYVNVLGHPTGRLIFKRDPYKINLQKIFEKAKQNKIALEINAFPERLDLNDIHVREAVEAGVKLAIGTDSHSTDHLHSFRLGIATARRGWAKKSDILNSLTLTKLMKFLKN